MNNELENRLSGLETKIEKIEEKLEDIKSGLALVIGLLVTDVGNDLAKMRYRTLGINPEKKERNDKHLQEHQPSMNEWDSEIMRMVEAGLELIVLHARKAVESLKNP